MQPPPNPLASEQRRQLLLFVRQTIEAALRKTEPPEAPPGFAQMGGCGAFVSLHTQSRLRGCVGVIESAQSLTATLARCALSSAFEDTRFRPLALPELSKIAVEISILSPLQPAAPEQVDAGRHGLLIRKHHFSGLLLPQVAQRYHWPRERFLDETCKKAGLPAGAWREPDAQIFTFTAEVFSE